ncbi:MAG: hypothetical protein HQ557_15630 [Bacteroidetes bacterium]|nr:hypothetical protein [Bacteroidota bacterium]
MKIKSITAAIITIVIILGGVFVTQLTGNWITESTKVPREITMGEFAGLSDPADIRGSYSFQDISDSFSISPEELAQAFSLDTSEKDADQYLAKDLEAIYGELIEGDGEVGTDSIKWFVALYLDYPYTPEETTLLPSPALALLKSKGVINDEEFQILKEKSISPTADSFLSENEDLVHVEISSEDRLIKGNTTFADLYSWDVTKEEIEEITGHPVGARAAVLRDYYAEVGIEFGTVKITLQELVDGK